MTSQTSKITTKTGDDGSTSLSNTRRVPKNHIRINVLGEIDELNAFIGLLRTENLSKDIQNCLATIQNQLFDLGAEISEAKNNLIASGYISFLEENMAKFESGLPPLKEFVLPCGARPSALAHVCRTVCRRAERSLSGLAEKESVSPFAIRYLNRLSDLFFLIARKLNQSASIAEELWKEMTKDAYL